MKKQTKVLLAAAALTLGASFTAMAATYDWKVEDGQWVCYDEDGDLYEDEWVESAGKDYYVGEDGVLAASEWIDGYYVDSTGAKTTNAWKLILPEGVDEDDEDAEAKWFYFGSKGKYTTGKKVINGVTYYFNNEGEILPFALFHGASGIGYALVVNRGFAHSVIEAWIASGLNIEKNTGTDIVIPATKQRAGTCTCYIKAFRNIEAYRISVRYIGESVFEDVVGLGGECKPLCG